MRKTTTGFTLVELLIVIVVIAILAAITIVAYNGVQAKARDSQRTSDISTIQKALEMYHIDHSGYPACDGSTYQPGGTRTNCTIAAISAALVPAYISSLPQDPKNTGDFIYEYWPGSKKTGDVTYAASADDNYMITASLESKGGPYITQLGAGTHMNYMVGSSR